VTSLLFSNDGATLYVGTEDGDLLVQSLRSTETPKSIAVGDQGCRVEGLAIAVRRWFPNSRGSHYSPIEKEQTLNRGQLKNNRIP
jgi:hypothetical protein